MLFTQSHIQTEIHTTNVIGIVIQSQSLVLQVHILMLGIEIQMLMFIILLDSEVRKRDPVPQLGASKTQVPKPAAVTVVDPVPAVAGEKVAKADVAVDDPRIQYTLQRIQFLRHNQIHTHQWIQQQRHLSQTQFDTQSQKQMQQFQEQVVKIQTHSPRRSSKRSQGISTSISVSSNSSIIYRAIVSSTCSLRGSTYTNTPTSGCS